MGLLSKNTPRDFVKSMKKKGALVIKNSVKKVKDFDYVEKGKDVVKKGRDFVKRVEDLSKH